MDDTVARLGRLDACAVSDALDKLQLAGVVTGIQRLTTDRRISGRVVTVKLEKDDGRPAASRHLGTTAIEAAQAGDVIVLEQRTGIDAACWGGNLSLAAQLRGVAGVVIDGPARDADEARDYDFPVFARSATSRTARGRIVETGTNVPIIVGDVQVSPGDLRGRRWQRSGLRQGRRYRSRAGCRRSHRRSRAADGRRLERAASPTQVMGKNYETMLKR